MNKAKVLLTLLATTSLILSACDAAEEEASIEETIAVIEDTLAEPVEAEQESEPTEDKQSDKLEEKDSAEHAVEEAETSDMSDEETINTKSEGSPSFEGYKLITVDGGDLSGYRQSNVVVDIGFGDREYWAFTNEHGQLVRVIADEIILQDDHSEPVTSNGRYYHDEAKVPGTEHAHLDEGHVIADSLGGVSNAYNITPQDSTLNRHDDQAYMEKVIRDAGGALNFEALITYPDTNTHIPSSYTYTYTVRGNTVVDEFVNGNPDRINEELGLTDPKPDSTPQPPVAPPASSSEPAGDLASVDANGNGKVTIQEAKDAGFKMPIYKDHWLYQYMDDRDGDGMVGE